MQPPNGEDAYDHHPKDAKYLVDRLLLHKSWAKPAFFHLIEQVKPEEACMIKQKSELLNRFIPFLNFAWTWSFTE